jgi:hypothetical protein
MPESPMTPPDRRQSPRTKLGEIAYIGMGPENGGLILDVSDGGLSFHAVAPVQPAEEIHFVLSLRGHGRIEGAGEVVWTNEMRTVCGLRFTSLSGGARELLNKCTNQSSASEAAREKAVSPAPAAIPHMHMEDPPASDAGTVTANPESIFAITPAAVDYLSEPTGKTMWWGQFFLWILLGLSCGALLGGAYLYGVHVGESEFKTEARSRAISESQASPPPVVPAPEPAPSVPSEAAPAQSGATSFPSVAPVEVPKPENKPSHAIQPPAVDEPGARSSDQRAEQALEAGKSELAAASSYLNGDNGARDSSKAVRLLWAAVGHGNSEAEVILAELYVKGDGVPKNCEQGRVLLLAAAKSGDPQAKVKLNELKTNGCP